MDKKVIVMCPLWTVIKVILVKYSTLFVGG